MRLARNAGRSALVALVRESLGGSRLVLGVDRLDYSKGIPERVKIWGGEFEIGGRKVRLGAFPDSIERRSSDFSRPIPEEQ